MENMGYEWLKFMLKFDVIPGLQLKVDADLNAGNITEKEAASYRTAIREYLVALIEK